MANGESSWPATSPRGAARRSAWSPDCVKKAHSRQSCSLRGRLLGTRGCGRAAVLSGARAARRPAWPAGPGAPGGVRAPRSCDCGASRRQATALGTAGTADWRRSPGFSEEEAYLLVLERQPEGRAAGWLPPRGHTGRSGTRWAGGRHLCALPPARAGVCPRLWSPGFGDCRPGDTSRSPGPGGQWGLCLQCHSTVRICIL